MNAKSLNDIIIGRMIEVLAKDPAAMSKLAKALSDEIKKDKELQKLLQGPKRG